MGFAFQNGGNFSRTAYADLGSASDVWENSTNTPLVTRVLLRNWKATKRARLRSKHVELIR